LSTVTIDLLSHCICVSNFCPKLWAVTDVG
jgi:hypothetical protein